MPMFAVVNHRKVVTEPVAMLSIVFYYPTNTRFNSRISLVPVYAKNTVDLFLHFSNYSSSFLHLGPVCKRDRTGALHMYMYLSLINKKLGDPNALWRGHLDIVT